MDGDGGSDYAQVAVNSADRTVRELLEVPGAGPSAGLSLAELHRELGYPESSLYMLLRTLAGRAG